MLFFLLFFLPLTIPRSRLIHGGSRRGFSTVAMSFFPRSGTTATMAVTRSSTSSFSRTTPTTTSRHHFLLSYKYKSLVI
uniref:Secreted peptide n=1 Tax=Lepeophtheirus salmonis TaxID=72036 RepID=A0A0K2TPF5_LEPSM